MAKSSSNEAVAYFYIDYLEGNHGTLGRLTSSLLRQLLQQLRSLPSSVVKAYEDFSYHGKKFTFDEACQALLDVATMFSRVYICIDALDELNEEEQQGLLKLIENLARTRIHVLISSRPRIQLDLFLYGNRDRVDWLYQLQISGSGQRSDIESFIRAKVESAGRLESQKELQAEIVREISTRAEGM